MAHSLAHRLHDVVLPDLVHGWHRAWRKVAIGVVATLAFLLLAVFIASFFIDEPLRAYMESTLNSQLDGYSAKLEGLDFHPFGFSITLEGLTIRQKAHPKPAMVEIPRFDASVQWKALIWLHLVADMAIERPELYIDRTQFEAESSDQKPVQDKGWQDAVESIYPLKINEFRVDDGDVTYVDSQHEKPMHVTHLDIVARNIRNVHNRGHKYPSPIQASAKVFGSGSLRVDGDADFLMEPHAGVSADIDLKGIPLERVKPVSNNANLWISNGVLDADGHIEYGPRVTDVHLKKVSISGVNVDYVHTPATSEAEAQRAETAKKTASQLSNAPQTVIRLDRLKIDQSRIGFVDKTTNPNYELVLADTDATLDGFSNQAAAGRAQLTMNAEFMGNGPTHLKASFQPVAKTADFNIDLGIEPTQLTSLNDPLRVYGDFDVVGGTFAFYTQIGVHDGKIDGYVKPLFHDMNIYAPRQDVHKNLLNQAYQGVLEGVKLIFENQRQTVATETPISGTVENPQTSTWDILINLAKNAFFKSIVPGFNDSLASKPPLPKQGG
jgi:Domain of Unknown Function (DUF748)